MRDLNRMWAQWWGTHSDGWGQTFLSVSSLRVQGIFALPSGLESVREDRNVLHSPTRHRRERLCHLDCWAITCLSIPVLVYGGVSLTSQSLCLVINHVAKVLQKIPKMIPTQSKATGLQQ